MGPQCLFLGEDWRCVSANVFYRYIMVAVIKKYAGLDFVPTISDSEDDVPVLDSSDDEKVEVKKVAKKVKGRKNKKKSVSLDELAEDVHEDLDAGFKFDLDAEDTTSNFQGWNFLGGPNEDDPEALVRKDVDLDKIIRRKGGLVKMAHIDSKEEDEEEEDSDDDELAMDGFGMGAPAKNEDEDDSEEEEQEEEEQEELTLEKTGKDDEVAEEDDSEEAKADFYAPETEGNEAKKQMYDNFNSLSLSRPVLKGLANLGYVTPSPIQSATIPIALLGKDIIAGAVTGSGKTAAFMIPIIERLLYKPAKIASTRVIVLLPTRELALQVADVGKQIARFVPSITFGLAVGGLNLRQQEQMLKSRPDIVIATPGRFIDHIRNSASFNVDSVEILVMDEADRMLEEGFQDELNEIMGLLPSSRQNLLFSATMNSKIKSLVSLSLKRPVRIMIDPPKKAATKLTQEFVRIRKRDHLKPALIFNLIRKLDPMAQKRIVVFVARKESAHRLRIIMGLLGMSVGELHGSLTQEQRLDSVSKFKNLEVPVLICTDLASRGLDIPKIEVVINYDMPKSHEVYLHRVGRTARAGREGRSVTFVGESSQDRSIVRAAIKSVEENKSLTQGKALGRNVDWVQVEKTNKLVESMGDTIEEILVEEKEEKEILRAEMQLRKGENMLKHKKEIQARPRRTWFQNESDKKNSKVLGALSRNKKVTNSKKRKREETIADDNGTRSYRKTKTDRSADQERAFKKQKSANPDKKKSFHKRR
ncbi:DRS1-like protein [Saccharomyces kudriavzevii IFO 1802]|uniref:ATP-dependent RNA helicase DRS1 n=2 Tax=Saccharomyces kudriavzevii (strain ATCC MYA-4449 / AS 2.2408 / CBS 8840 / NBRC 1802 / NCYC 2889) TaxID=226230 RepID=J6EHS3_SACK1|nr:DRS1-like protein [Saccharomyces kudriavzevii IFO 1802]